MAPPSLVSGVLNPPFARDGRPGRGTLIEQARSSSDTAPPEHRGSLLVTTASSVVIELNMDTVRRFAKTHRCGVWRCDQARYLEAAEHTCGDGDLTSAAWAMRGVIRMARELNPTVQAAPRRDLRDLADMQKA